MDSVDPVQIGSVLGTYGYIGTMYRWGYHSLPVKDIPMHLTPSSRSTFAFQCAVPSVCVLAAVNIFPPKESDSNSKNETFNNRVDFAIQTGVHAISLMALSTYLDPTELRLLPIISGGFIVGSCIRVWGVVTRNSKAAMVGKTVTSTLNLSTLLYLAARGFYGSFLAQEKRFKLNLNS